MEDYFKFPLNEAHFLQRKAEKYEIKGHFEVAIENRTKALHNLEDAVNSTLCPVIKETINLEINIENQKIELLRRKKSCYVEKFRKTVKNNSIKMAQAKCPPMTLEIPLPNVVHSQDICDKLSDYAFRILQNTEKIESSLNSLHDKVKIENSKQDTNTLADREPISLEELEETVKSLKSRNVDNIYLLKNFSKDVSILKSENAVLKAKIYELQNKNDKGHNKSAELLNGSGTSPFIVLPVGVEDLKSTDVTIPDFPPLHCPTFDYLTIGEVEKF